MHEMLKKPDKYVSYYVLEFLENRNAPRWVGRAYLYVKYCAESCFYFWLLTLFLNEYVAVCIVVALICAGLESNWQLEKPYLERPKINIFRPSD